MANRATVNGIMRIFFSMVIKLSLQKEWYFPGISNLHKNLGFLCQSNKKQDHLPLFRLIRTLGTQFFVIFRSPVINL